MQGILLHMVRLEEIVMEDENAVHGDDSTRSTEPEPPRTAEAYWEPEDVSPSKRQQPGVVYTDFASI